MKHILIPLLLFLFLSSAFADPCADQTDAYRNSHREYLRISSEKEKASEAEYTAYRAYNQALLALSDIIKTAMISSIPSENDELNRNIDTAYDAVKMSFRYWETAFNQKDRIFHQWMKAKDALSNLEQALLQCEDQNRQQE